MESLNRQIPFYISTPKKFIIPYTPPLFVLYFFYITPVKTSQVGEYFVMMDFEKRRLK